MKPFLSWSKDLSRETAKRFAAWLPTVIQECNESFLSHEISKGDPWFETITTNLKTCELGIVFITTENQHEPWLNFEAGALLNKFGKSGVCPVLVGLKKADYVGPLSNLQLTEIESDADMRGLLGTINQRCLTPLSSEVLRTMFDTFWPTLVKSVEDGILTAPQPSKAGTTGRTADQKIDEILNLVRAISSEQEDLDRLLANEHSTILAAGNKRRLEYFAKKYGSDSVYRRMDNEIGHVIEFAENDDGLQYVVAVFKDDPNGRVYLTDEFEVCPF